jgi:hypothetical protein
VTRKQTHVYGLCPHCRDSHIIERGAPLDQLVMCGWCGNAATAIEYVSLGRAEREKMGFATSKLDAE